MKYMNTEVASALATSVVISLVMYFLNRNNKEQIPLQIYIKTFAINSLIIVGLLYLKKNVLDNPGSMLGGAPPAELPVAEFSDISVGTPTF